MGAQPRPPGGSRETTSSPRQLYQAPGLVLWLHHPKLHLLDNARQSHLATSHSMTPAKALFPNKGTSQFPGLKMATRPGVWGALFNALKGQLTEVQADLRQTTWDGGAGSTPRLQGVRGGRGLDPGESCERSCLAQARATLSSAGRGQENTPALSLVPSPCCCLPLTKENAKPGWGSPGDAATAGTPGHTAV